MNMFSYYIIEHFIPNNKCGGQNLSLCAGFKVSFFNNNAYEEKKARRKAP